jgi:phytoene synthase
MDADSGAPLASFEAKWTAFAPEFGLALKFVSQRERVARSAFACLVFELEHAAYATRDAEPAAIKLQWWAEELTRAREGAARHPLTQVLAAHPAFTALAPTRWYAVIRGALAQRDPEPAADSAALLETYAALYRPLAAIETELFPGIEAQTLTRVLTLSRALRETASLAESLHAGRLPLPLDTLARHRLARGDLMSTSAPQVALLHEWLAWLAAEFRSVRTAQAGVLGAAAAVANRVRARAGSRAADPLAELNAAYTRVPFAAVWAAWRAGRRARD